MHIRPPFLRVLHCLADFFCRIFCHSMPPMPDLPNPSDTSDTAALPPVLQTIPADIASVSDYERYAQARVAPEHWSYLNGASADGITASENRAAFDRLRLRSRVLVPLQNGGTKMQLLGDTLEAPLLVAPMAYQTLAHPQGEQAIALGAAAVRLGMVVSTQAATPLEALAKGTEPQSQQQAEHHTPCPLWFQLYIQPDRDFTLQLAKRAARADYRALVVTVDAPVNGLRNAEQRAGFALPREVRAVNLDGMRTPTTRTAGAGQSAVFGSGVIDYAPTWQDLRWLVQHSRLPILVKGILHPADAQKALDTGAAGIIVSNHGGRTLDTLPAAIDVLPEIVRAAARHHKHAPVLMDGGIQRGTDIFKALALGAKAVLVGRPVMHGLAAAGATGVAHVLHLLRSELEVAMALMGCRTLADINPECLYP